MQATSTPDLLEAALEAVQEALRHPASTIFRKPVDHVGLKLTDYTTVIPNPCDLGTICKQLEAGRKSNWRRSSYSSVHGVLADCLRVFENCEVYNRNDPGTRQLADDARQVFLSAWQVAGLSGPKPRKSASKPVSNGKQDSPAPAKKEKAGARRSSAAADSPDKPASKPEPEQAPIDPASCKPEAEVPARFSIQSGEDELPLRLLDNFSLSGGKRGSQLTGLEALDGRGGTSLTLRGTLLLPTGRSAKRNGQHFNVEVKDVLDWLAAEDSGDNGKQTEPPSVWVLTSSARYRLLTPAAAYAVTFARTMRRLPAAGRNAAAANAADSALAAAGADPAALEEGANARLEGKPGPSRSRAAAAESGGEKRSRKRQADHAQGSAEQQRGEAHDEKPGGPLTKRLKVRLGSAGAADLGSSQTPRLKVKFGGGGGGGGGIAGKAAGDGQSSRQDVPAKELLYSSAKASDKRRADEAARRREKQQVAREARAAAAAEALRQRQRKEKAASNLRGPPPPLHRDFRLPPDLLPDLLVVWEFTQSYGGILGLAPFPLWRLEAAVAPGPTQLPAAQPAAPPDARRQGKAAADAVDPIIRTRRKREEGEASAGSGIKVRLKVEGADTPSSSGGVAPGDAAAAAATPAAATAEGGGALPRPAFTGPLVMDEAGAASAVLLRDVHCALLRAYQDKVQEEEVPPRLRATLQSPDSSGPGTWMSRCGVALLTAPLGWIDDTHRDAGLAMAYGDHVDVSPEQRVAALLGLTTLALTGSRMRDLLARRAEEWPPAQRAAQQPAAPPQATTAANGMPGGAAPGGAMPPAASAPQQLPATFSGPVAEWLRWRDGARLGLRRALGWDYHRRRYWAFGSAAAAWRLYVESENGTSWGWYDGEDIAAVVAWLQRGRIDREAGLLKALSAIPLVRSLPVAPVAPAMPGMPQPPQPPAAQVSLPASAVLGTQGQSEPLPVLSTTQLAANRPDGYTGILAPLMRGEGNWATLGMFASMEGRILSACDALLGCAPFWFRGQRWLQKHAMSLERIAAARTPGEMASAVAAIEESLAEAGIVSGPWLAHWQQRWRASIAAAPDMRAVLLHVAALQEEVGRDEKATGGVVLPRTAFLHSAAQLHCPLFLPWPGDQVVLLRSGLLRHLRTYMCRLGIMRPVHRGQPQAQQPAGPRRGRRPQPDSAAGIARAQAEAARIAHYNATSPMQTAAALRQQQQQQAADSDGRRSPTAEQADDGAAAGPAPKLLSTAIVPPVDDHTELEDMEPADEAGAMLAAQWKQLLAHVQALRPLERFRVASVGYRRSLAVGEPADVAVPVLWLLLRPSKLGPLAELPAEELGVPLQLDRGLPDYVVPADAFDAGRRHAWAPGNRFRMYFGGKKGGPTKRSGGVYYKGFVNAVKPMPVPGVATPEEVAAFDPWESVRVEWDVTARDEDKFQWVSPWEIERDPEEDAIWEEKRRRAAEAEARAARAARAKGRRLYGPSSDDEGGAQRQRTARAGSAALGAVPGSQPAALAAAQPGAGQLPAADQLQQPQQQQQASPVFEVGRSLPDDRGGEVPPEVLDSIRPLDREQLTRMLTNYLLSVRGKFKPIIFARLELDLHRVFWEVQNRGGYDAVCRGKQWKEVCRSLDLDLRGQTSASYNMRLNYEKSLLDFEHYLSSGSYAADLAAGKEPRHDVVMELPRSGGASLRSTPVSLPAAQLPQPPLVAQPPPAAPPAPPPEAPGRAMSFTALLVGGDDEAPPASQPVAAAPAAQPALAQPAAAPAPQPVPPGVGAAGAAGLQLGQVLEGMARQLLGQQLLRNWPEEGGWFHALVSDYLANTREHKLTYNVGKPEETFEWTRLSELAATEVALDAAAPITLPAPGAQPPAAPPAPALHAAASQAVAAALAAALQAGLSPAALHQLVDAAAALQQPPPAAPPQPQLPLSRLRVKSNLLDAAAAQLDTPAAGAGAAGLLQLAASAAQEQAADVAPEAGAPSPQAAAAGAGQLVQGTAGGQPSGQRSPAMNADAPPPQATQQTAGEDGPITMQLEAPNGVAVQADAAAAPAAAATSEASLQQGAGQAALPHQPVSATRAPDLQQANGFGDGGGHDSSCGAAIATHPGAGNLHNTGAGHMPRQGSPHQVAVVMEVDDTVPANVQPLKLKFKLHGSKVT